MVTRKIKNKTNEKKQIDEKKGKQGVEEKNTFEYKDAKITDDMIDVKNETADIDIATNDKNMIDKDTLSDSNSVDDFDSNSMDESDMIADTDSEDVNCDDDNEMIEKLENLKDFEIEDFYSDTANIKISDARKIINTVINHFNISKSVNVLKLIHLVNVEYNMGMDLHKEVLSVINKENVGDSFYDFFKLYILDLSCMSEIREIIDKLLKLAFDLPSKDSLDVLHVIWLICRIYKVKIDGNDVKYFVNGIIPIKKAALKIINASNDITKFDKYTLVSTSEWKPVTSYIK